MYQSISDYFGINFQATYKTSIGKTNAFVSGSEIRFTVPFAFLLFELVLSLIIAISFCSLIFLFIVYVISDVDTTNTMLKPIVAAMFFSILGIWNYIFYRKQRFLSFVNFENKMTFFLLSHKKVLFKCPLEKIVANLDDSYLTFQSDDDIVAWIDLDTIDDILLKKRLLGLFLL